MIPEFDGTSRYKLQEFLNACTYAVQNINPADEETLIQAILYTKLKGKAIQDFETREVQTYDELKQFATRQSKARRICKLNLIRLNKNQMKPRTLSDNAWTY